jgi:hypothetical protein
MVWNWSCLEQYVSLSPRTESQEWYADRFLETTSMLKFWHLTILLLDVLAQNHSAQCRGNCYRPIQAVPMLLHRTLADE